MPNCMHVRGTATEIRKCAQTPCRYWPREVMKQRDRVVCNNKLLSSSVKKRHLRVVLTILMSVTAASTCEQRGASNLTTRKGLHRVRWRTHWKKNATNLNFRHFMEAEGSLPCSQEPTTCSYHEPDHSTLRAPVLFPFKLNFNIVLHLRLGLPNGLVIQICQLKPRT